MANDRIMTRLCARIATHCCTTCTRKALQRQPGTLHQVRQIHTAELEAGDCAACGDCLTASYHQYPEKPLGLRCRVARCLGRSSEGCQCRLSASPLNLKAITAQCEKESRCRLRSAPTAHFITKLKSHAIPVLLACNRSSTSYLISNNRSPG